MPAAKAKLFGEQIGHDNTRIALYEHVPGDALGATFLRKEIKDWFGALTLNDMNNQGFLVGKDRLKIYDPTR